MVLIVFMPPTEILLGQVEDLWIDGHRSACSLGLLYAVGLVTARQKSSVHGCLLLVLIRVAQRIRLHHQVRNHRPALAAHGSSACEDKVVLQQLDCGAVDDPRIDVLKCRGSYFGVVIGHHVLKCQGGFL
jgi:hypothetical protein